jgi:hypothetical protein
MKPTVKFVLWNTCSILVQNSLKQRDVFLMTAFQFCFKTYHSESPTETGVTETKWNTLSTICWRYCICWKHKYHNTKTDTCSSLISRNHNNVIRTNKSSENMTDFSTWECQYETGIYICQICINVTCWSNVQFYYESKTKQKGKQPPTTYLFLES